MHRCAQLSSIRTLSLCGCMRCGDGAAAALGRHCSSLTSLNLELLTKLTDIGVQAVVRGTLTPTPTLALTLTDPNPKPN